MLKRGIRKHPLSIDRSLKLNTVNWIVIFSAEVLKNPNLLKRVGSLRVLGSLSVDNKPLADNQKLVVVTPMPKSP